MPANYVYDYIEREICIIKTGGIGMSRKYSAYKTYDILKRRILTCKYKPGQLIFEKSIVDDFGISRTPVREALNILQGEGLVKIIPKKGIQISPLSIKKVRQIHELRKVLEAMAIRQAIRYLKPKDIEYLTKLDETLADSIGSQNVTDIFKYGKDIHLYIAKMSRNETLFGILKQLREESYRGYVYFMEQFLYISSDSQRQMVENRIANEHSRIIEALKNRDEEKAVEYLIADLDTMSEFIMIPN
mgnify:CR=1 FL=1